MWFKRKPQNRRLSRDYVLDVKLRSSQARAARSRTLAFTLGGFFAVAFGCYLVYRIGGWTLDELVYQNKAFALKELDIQTDGILSADQLRRWSGVRFDENLLALDLPRVKRDLEMVSVIQSASVELILPHTLRIRVVEREPVAQINVVRPRANTNASLAAYYVDAAGWVMLPVGAHERATPAKPAGEQLPVLSGLDATLVQPGKRIDAPQVQAALQLVLAFEQSSMAGLVDLKRIEVSSPDALVVTTGQGSEVTFGLADIEQQLRRWHDIFDMGQRLSKAISTLDLAVTNNVPARWLEASAVPANSPKLPKPSRSKKKHV
jgi:cell division protein FtsQ